jgi:hypothetical protein
VRRATIDPMIVRHLILGMEAVLMHQRLERRPTAAERAALRDQLLALALVAAGSPGTRIRPRASGPSARPARRRAPARRSRR